ncbi:MmcQ/YjbR family DNA-binding protein [Nonlabens xiamenensis]|uniref:MmcQ/YjbR family DNA-binding protein n=1 Tax=Nonlabens xiamenensis TaxID=2341043 RepID=UPI000F608973|nr:MmcQ/YjbR family DNA-binding protein [Nonlabens xiamenensis]
MEIDAVRTYCLSKKGSSESFPFDQHTLVFKVMGKMFCLAGLEKWEKGEKFINLKCDPEKAIDLREEYQGTVSGGFHMSKKYWNTVYCDKDMSPEEICHWIDHSYEQVVAKLSRKDKESLNQL